jgi:DinB superfamily
MLTGEGSIYGGVLIDNLWRTILWKQFGAAIDMLDNTLVACPDSLWTQRLWRNPPPPEFPLQFAEFWYVTFHTLVWLDLYLSGIPEEEIAPPAPFAQGVLDSVEAQPERPYTREELRAYLASTRQKCRSMLIALTDQQPRRPVEYPWSQGQPISFLELQRTGHSQAMRVSCRRALARALGHHGVGCDPEQLPALAGGGVTTLQYAPCAGTCGRTEPFSRTTWHPDGRLGDMCEG